MTAPHRKAWAELCEFAQGFPEAVEDHPWGETVYKVRKKVFLFSGCGEEGVTISVKLPDSADAALATDFAQPSGYGLGQHGWVTCRFPPTRKPPTDLLRAWVEESYRAVAPRKLVALLDESPLRRGLPPRRSRRP